MAKLREGIEIPIIPEDFIDSEAYLCSEPSGSISQWSGRCFRTDADLLEWVVKESILVPCPER
jgi:hypothetical protein